MSKKESIFKRLKIIISRNPIILWAIAWVTVMPSVGSFFFLKFLYSNVALFRDLDFYSIGTILGYLIVTAIVMGAALMPTTLIAIISGFLFGWVAFPALVIAYTLASIIGYKLGTGLDENSLNLLLEKYPKTKKLLLEKEDKMNELIFFLRLSPVIPFALSNLLFALIRANLTKVIWVGLLGMFPRTTMAFATGLRANSLVDAVSESTNTYQLAGILVLLLISIWGLYRVISRIVDPSR
jgi:uncharacterized membrane protein YdjX (TVP38/TMEM64 family)